MSDGVGGRRRAGIGALRRGLPDDAPSITRVHQLSWESTYRGIVPDDLVDAVTTRDSSARWRERVVDPELDTFVVELSPAEARELGLDPREPGVVGFACGGAVGQLRAESSLPDDCGLVHTLYLRPEVGRQGLGRRLMEALHESFRARGLRRSCLGVHPLNARARAFYERLGYRVHGEEFSHVLGGAALPTLECRRSL
jgi:ribosomal protein S18 acetylase RimI-like enzyme